MSYCHRCDMEQQVCGDCREFSRALREFQVAADRVESMVRTGAQADSVFDVADVLRTRLADRSRERAFALLAKV